MSDEPISDPAKRSRLAWLFFGLLFGVALFYGARGISLPIASYLRLVPALVLVCAGLGLLVPLAACGPRTADQRANRVRTSVTGAGQIILGIAQLIPDWRVSVATLLVAVVLTLAAVLRVPSALFAPRA